MGKNTEGRLGVGAADRFAAPQVLGAPNQRPVVAVAVGMWHSAFIAGPDLYVMGSNSFGLGWDIAPPRHPLFHSRVSLPTSNQSVPLPLLTSRVHPLPAQSCL